MSKGVLPAIYTSTIPAWGNDQKQVALAFLFLFGRAPDTGGLNYWIGQTPGTSGSKTFFDALATINDQTASVYLEPINAPNGAGAAFMQDIYVYVLGRALPDELDNPPSNPSGIDYWGDQINNATEPTLGGRRANICNIIYNILAASPAPDDLAYNRFLMLEAVVRAQLFYNRDLGYQTSETVVRMVVGTTASFDDAMSVVTDFVINNNTKPTSQWFKTYTQSSIASESVTAYYDNFSTNGTTIHKYLAWWNSSGDLLQAEAILPSGFGSVTSNTLRCVISVHGGGWRGATIERLQSYNVKLAGATAAPVVLSTAVRLSRYSYFAPSAYDDLVDFKTLVESSPSIGIFRINTAKISYFGESSGGHLVLLLGSKSDVGRVFSLYAPVDLTGLSVSQYAAFQPYISSYTNETYGTIPAGSVSTASSPYSQWTSNRTTVFQLWHGDTDDVVSYANATSFETLINDSSKITVHTVSGEGHGFSLSTQASVVAAANTMFNI